MSIPEDTAEQAQAIRDIVALVGCSEDVARMMLAISAGDPGDVIITGDPPEPEVDLLATVTSSEESVSP